ncbi:MAG TPA: hypothetical protein VHT51_01250 [Micropepsaceae bacterium]|jgi:hypothetical protein|nr:hypothetical protein [Micropepsaceae bacterium]
MTTFTTLHPLKYIAEALAQMATTLRDFEMQESAQLLDKAKSEIDHKLSERPKKETMQAR